MKGLNNTEKLLVILLLLAGAFLRLYNPLQYPLAINQDELNNIYDGWSLAETGKDRWETPNPFILRGLGDGDNRPALQAWLFAGVFKITGFSVAGGRTVNALLGALSLWLLFLFLKNSFNNTVAFAGLALASLSAWHVLFSRMAHEGTVLPFLFVILILYLWQKYRTNNYTNFWQVLLLGFVVGFSTNSYQSAKVSALVFCVAIAADILISTQKKIKPMLALGLGSFTGALPQLYTLFTDSEVFFARAKNQSISFDSIESIWQVVKNIGLNFNPEYLFFSSGTHNNLSIYRLYPVESIFFYTGLILVIINYKKLKARFPLLFIAVAVFAAVLPAALTYSNPHALRASGFVIIAPILTALGWVFLTGAIKKGFLLKVIYSAGLLTLAIYCFVTTRSYHQSVDLRSRNQQYHLVKMYEKLEGYKDKFSNIYIENTTGESYLYLISFCGIAPKDFQKMDKEYYRATFDEFNRLGKYRFIKNENWKTVLDTVTKPDPLIVSTVKFENNTVMDSVVFESSTFYFTEFAAHSNSKAE